MKKLILVSIVLVCNTLFAHDYLGRAFVCENDTTMVIRSSQDLTTIRVDTSEGSELYYSDQHQSANAFTLHSLGSISISDNSIYIFSDMNLTELHNCEEILAAPGGMLHN